MFVRLNLGLARSQQVHPTQLFRGGRFSEDSAMQSTIRSSHRASMKSLGLLGALALAATTLTGCNNAVEGGASGAALGALAGMGIGSLSGDMGKGAAAGAIGGAILGGILGDQNNRSGRTSGYSSGY